MTRGLVALGLALAVMTLACTDAVPCTSCPALAGSYAMIFQETSRSADCATLPPPAPPSRLELTQAGSTGRATVGALDLVGTIYDTWDFVLSGTGSPDGGPASESVSVRGRFVAPPSGHDGGSSIQGTWTAGADAQVTGTALSCSVELSFTGTRP